MPYICWDIKPKPEEVRGREGGEGEGEEEKEEEEEKEKKIHGDGVAHDAGGCRVVRVPSSVISPEHKALQNKTVSHVLPLSPPLSFLSPLPSSSPLSSLSSLSFLLFLSLSHTSKATSNTG